MAVFRVEKNSGYTVMSNHHLRNRALSLKAKGLLSQMLSLPEDWDYTLQGLARINRESIDAIRQAIRELEQAGYIQRSRERDEKGRLRGADYVIFELPQPVPASVSPTLENPTLENPTQENPTLENPMQLNKDLCLISEIIEKWIKGILIDGITGNLSGLFDNVNAKVGEIASDVGSTPQAWNSGIFNMLRNLSETVVLPIAAAILALVMCHELIQMITEKNNMHDFDTSMFFRWIFKSAFAILIVSNTWNIVMGVFDATQSVVNQSSGVIIGETSINFDRLIPGLEFQLESMTIGSLLSLWFQTLVVGLTMNILSICIFLVTYGRMIEIYVVTALGPIPLATMGSSEWRSTGQNYLKSLLALGFQAFLIMIVVGIYAVLIRNISGAADIAGAIWGCMGYTVLLCFCLFKTGSISKSVFGAH